MAVSKRGKRIVFGVWIAILALMVAAALGVSIFLRVQEAPNTTINGYISQELRALALQQQPDYESHSLYLVDLESGEQEKIAITGANRGYGLLLSPDKTRLLLTWSDEKEKVFISLVDLSTGSVQTIDRPQGYWYYEWVNGDLLVLYPERISTDTPLLFYDGRTLSLGTFLSFSPQDFAADYNESGSGRVEPLSICYDEKNARYLIGANVYYSKDSSPVAMIISCTEDGREIERLVSKSDMALPMQGDTVRPSLAVLSNGYIAVNLIETVQQWKYNRLLIYDEEGQLVKNLAGSSLQTRMEPVLSLGCFAALADPSDGDYKGYGSKVQLVDPQTEELREVTALHLGARSGQVYSVFEGQDSLYYSAFISLVPNTERVHALFRAEKRSPLSAQPIAFLPTDAVVAGCSSDGSLVVFTGENPIELPDVSEPEEIATPTHEGYVKADYNTVVKSLLGEGTVQKIYFQGYVDTAIQASGTLTTTVTISTTDGVYEISNYNRTTMHSEIHKGDYVKCYALVDPSKAALPASGIVPVEVQYLYDAQGNEIPFDTYSTVNDCVIASVGLLDIAARNGFGQRFYLDGTVSAVAKDSFTIDDRFVVRQVTENIQIGDTLGVEAIFNSMEGEYYIFYPEVIYRDSQMIYNGTGNVLPETQSGLSAFAQSLSQSVIGSTSQLLEPMLVGDGVLVYNIYTYAEMTVPNYLREMGVILDAYVQKMEGLEGIKKVEINLHVNRKLYDTAPVFGFEKLFILTIPVEQLLEENWTGLRAVDFQDNGYLYLVGGDLSQLVEETPTRTIDPQKLVSVSTDGKSSTTILASLGQGKYVNPVYLPGTNKLLFSLSKAAVVDDKTVSLSTPALAAYSFRSGLLETSNITGNLAERMTQVNGALLYVGVTTDAQPSVMLLDADKMTLSEISMRLVDAEVDILALLYNRVSQEYLLIAAPQETTADYTEGEILLYTYDRLGNIMDLPVHTLLQMPQVKDGRNQPAITLDHMLFLPVGGQAQGEEDGPENPYRLAVWNLKTGLVGVIENAWNPVFNEQAGKVVMLLGSEENPLQADKVVIASSGGQEIYRITQEDTGEEGLIFDRILQIPQSEEIIITAYRENGEYIALRHTLGDPDSTRFAADLTLFKDCQLAGVNLVGDMIYLTPFKLPEGMTAQSTNG